MGWIAGLLALSGGFLFLRSMLAHTGGVPSPPLDDTYIYLQYARRAAEGHFLSYCDGAPPSTGASSYLHLLLLVPGWWAGFHGPSFVFFAVALGVLYLGITLSCVGRLAPELSGSPGRWWLGLFAMALVALNGHFVWAAMTGMDTVLLAAGLTAIAAGVAVRGPRPGWPWLVAGSLSSFRPEGMALGILGLFVLYIAAHREARLARETGVVKGTSSLKRLLFLGAGLLLLFVPPLVNWLATRSPVWDGVLVKSFANETRPDILKEVVRRLPEVWRDIVLLHVKDFRSPPWSVPAGWVLMGLCGLGLLAGFVRLISGRGGPAGLLVVLWFSAGVLLGGFSPAWSSHYFRYQIPYAAFAAVLTVTGWDALARLAGSGRTLVTVGALSGIAVLLTPGFTTMRDLYGRNCANILEQQTKVARWIETNTHPVSRVAVNDAGAIAYYGDRRIVDLVGLTTHGFAQANHNGAGALFEKLETMPDSTRPHLLAIFPRWYPYLVATHFAGETLMSADLADNTICGDRLMRVYRIDWDLARTGDLPVQRGPLIKDFGMHVADQVDVEDLDSEAAHRYEWRDNFKDRLREYPTADGPVVEDGGRWISEGERMTVKAHPGNWLILVMRTETETPFLLDVSVNGRPAGQLAAERVSGSFTEPILQIPDSLVTDSLLTVDVQWARNVRGNGYSSYHYWFLQP